MNNGAFLLRLRVPVGCTTELNHSGHEFLQQLFDKYDDVSARTFVVFSFWFSYSEEALCFLLQDKDSALSPTELTNLFRVCPYMPWGDGVYVSVPTSAEGYISNHGYHCQWMWVSQSVGDHLVWLVSMCYMFLVRLMSRNHTRVIAFSYQGFLHILISTVVWSIWGT